MAQREWVEKDFYKELGVSSDASDKEIKQAYRKLASEFHPDKNPAGAERFKAISEAYSVLSDDAKKKEYDETRRLFAGGGMGGRRFDTGGFGGFGPGGADGGEFNLNDLFGAAGQAGGGNIGDLFGGLFGRGGAAQRPTRPRRGKDLETETELDFIEAAKGAAMIPLRLTSPAPCTNCHGSGARPGTSPKVCPGCNGSGMVNRNQGSFGFSEPCTECRGSGSIIEHPCSDCHGTGVATRTRTINVRIPPGVGDGQRIRLAGQGEAGLRGAPSGDLFVTVKVRPDKVFSRDGDDLKVTVPVSFAELALGATLSVPTLDGTVGVRVPKGTTDGRILRVRGRGIAKRNGGNGDLLVTVKVSVPENLEGAALEALEVYAAAEKASGFDPRANWAGKS